MTRADFIELGYLVAASLFIIGLKGLSRPRTARRGNLIGAAGMLVAVVVTLIDQAIVSYWVLAAGLIVGSGIGVVLAVRVKMTSMPELVALFNGFGGAASVLVAGASFVEAVDLGLVDTETSTAAAATAIIGAVTFTGSVVAFAKLRESLHWHGFSGIRAVNTMLAAVSLALAAMVVIDPGNTVWLWALVAVSSVLGLLVVVPIGGADMPVVIALLNSMSGLAASATGFVLNNTLLIIAGALVGASGLILTQIMSVAMNRSALSVLFTDAPTSSAEVDADEVYAGKIRSTSAEEVAMILETAGRVVIVPGYGLAVAQAQHAVSELAKSLEANGTDVVFAIHPVAGRMPGHMNVLLAEAEIDYEKLLEMDAANPTFAQTDVAIVLGANDVVNPSANTDPNSPIAGMPILEVGDAQTVVVIKRSLSPGFAGIPNPLFAADNALMLFGDGKVAITAIIKALAEA